MTNKVVALGALLVALVLGAAAEAGAQEPPTTTTTAPGGTTETTLAGQPSPTGESVRGTMFYNDENDEKVLVADVEVRIDDVDGNEIATVTTDEEGVFQVALPGPGSYTATIDPDTLPDGISMRDKDRLTLSFDMSTGQTRNLLYPLQSGEGGGRSSSSFFDRALRLLVEGIRFGLIIAMCAIGLSLIFGTTGLTNFSHGELVTFGALIAYLFNVTIGWHMYIAAPLAVAVAVLFGAGLDLFFWRPLRNRGTGLIAMLVISIGLGIFLRYLFNIQFGGFTRTYAQFSLQRDGIEIGPVNLVPRDLIGMIISVIALVAVALFLQRTKTGKATRAVADNRDLAESSGINVARVITFVWAAGAGLAALGGILQGLSEQVSWQMGFQLLLLMFAGVTLGGLGTAFGALVGSMVVGMVMEVSTLWIPSEFKTVTALAILIVILVFRPQGILGQAERVG
jgi:branched-chain amino acid transport system permease protein